MPDLIRQNAVLILVAIVALGAWFALRTSATTFEPGSSLDTVLAGDGPVVLEFFGNT